MIRSDDKAIPEELELQPLHGMAQSWRSRLHSSNIPLWLLLTFLLAITALSLFTILCSAPSWTIDIGTPSDTRFSWGFFPAEVDGNHTFRWSGLDTRLVLHGVNAGPLSMELELYGNKFVKDRRRRLALSAWTDSSDLGQTIAAMDVPPGWRTYRVLLPRNAVGSGIRPLVVSLVNDTHRPSAHDRRNLGVAVDWVRVTPLKNTPGVSWAVLERSLFLTWGLALLAGVLWYIDRRLLQGTPRRTLPRVCVLTGIAAVGLIISIERDPHTVAWAIPSMPWTFGLVSLGLIIFSATSNLTTQSRSHSSLSYAGRTMQHEPGSHWFLGQWKPRLWPLDPDDWLLATDPYFHVRYMLWCGLGLLTTAQILFYLQRFVGVGIVLALLGLSLLWRKGLGENITAGQQQQANIQVAAARIGLGLIFLLALGLRFYHITDLPYGLWRDEARHGLLALRMLEDQSYRPIYIHENGVDMPALGLYPFALAIKLWGIHLWSMRSITALAGALTVLPLYAFVHRLTEQRGVALVAAALLAVSSWHLTISRFSFPTIFDPLFGLTGLWLLLIGLGSKAGDEHRRSKFLIAPRYRQLIACLFSGGAIGIALQTYHTGRIVPIMAAVLALLLLVRQPDRWRRWLIGIVTVGVGFLLVAGPFIAYALHAPEMINNRVSDVFLLNDGALKGRAPLAALDESIGRHLLMFNVRGDANGRHHAPDRPMLDFVTGFGFLIGCVVVLRRWRDWRYSFLLTGLVLGIVPSLLSVDGPHGMRSIGSLAFACMIAALGWAEIWRLLDVAQRDVRAAPWRQKVKLQGMTLSMLALAWGLNCWTYFVQMPVTPRVWTAFYPIHTQIGTYLHDLASQKGVQALDQIYVPASLTDNAVFTYLTHGLHVQTIDDLKLSGHAQPGALFLLSGYSYQKDLPHLSPYLGRQPLLMVRGPNLPGGDDPSFVGYTK